MRRLRNAVPLPFSCSEITAEPNTQSPLRVQVIRANLIDEGVRYRSFGGREQYAYIGLPYGLFQFIGTDDFPQIPSEKAPYR